MWIHIYYYFSIIFEIVKWILQNKGQVIIDKWDHSSNEWELHNPIETLNRQYHGKQQQKELNHENKSVCFLCDTCLNLYQATATNDAEKVQKYMICCCNDTFISHTWTNHSSAVQRRFFSSKQVTDNKKRKKQHFRCAGSFFFSICLILNVIFWSGLWNRLSRWILFQPSEGDGSLLVKKRLYQSSNASAVFLQAEYHRAKLHIMAHELLGPQTASVAGENKPTIRFLIHEAHVGYFKLKSLKLQPFNGSKHPEPPDAHTTMWEASHSYFSIILIQCNSLH